MKEAHAGLLAALHSLLGVPCERSLATNSLKFRFDCRESEKGRAYIWIDPPWRMTSAGKFVTGSRDGPVWDGGEDKEVNQPLWEAWSALFDPLNRTILVDASVGEQLPDLRLVFESGHQIETFGNADDDCWWYYCDRVTGEVFEANATGVDHEYAELAGD